MSLEDVDSKVVNDLLPISTKNSLYAFTKSFRIKKSHEYAKVFDEGKKFVTRTVIVFSLETAAPSSRFGLVVSKKSVGMAVFRNKVKRRLREICRHIVPLENGARDIVVIARTQALKSHISQLEKDMKKALYHLAGTGIK